MTIAEAREAWTQARARAEELWKPWREAEAVEREAWDVYEELKAAQEAPKVRAAARAEEDADAWRDKTRACKMCASVFTPETRNQQFCDGTCRKAYHGWSGDEA